jgi:hypothetical protein
MTPLRWTAIALTAALLGLTCVAILPIAGYTTTAGLWLTYTMVASGLTTVATVVFAMAALTPPHTPTAPYEPLPTPRAYVVRDALPVASYELEAGQ